MHKKHNTQQKYNMYIHIDYSRHMKPDFMLVTHFAESMDIITSHFHYLPILFSGKIGNALHLDSQLIPYDSIWFDTNWGYSVVVRDGGSRRFIRSISNQLTEHRIGYGLLITYYYDIVIIRIVDGVCMYIFILNKQSCIYIITNNI